MRKTNKPPLDVLPRLWAEELERLLLPADADDDEEAEAEAATEEDDDDDDCLVAFEDFLCLDDDDEDEEAIFVVILMLVAEVDEAVALMVESISFSGDEPESDDVSWLMGL